MSDGGNWVQHVTLLTDDKCGKRNKVVRNGILCHSCNKWYHFGKCSDVFVNKIPE